MKEKQAIRAFQVILIAFVMLGLAASIINPLHEATDELRHYRFVRHIVQYRSLPVQGRLPCRVQGHHPPLFYTIGALATFWIDTGRDVCYDPPKNPFWDYRYWEVGRDNKNQYLHGADEAFPWRGEALAAHIVRAINVLIGAGVVWLTWAIARTIWPKRPWLGVGAAAFVAFNPMFVYMSGAINNDIMAAFSGAAVTLACVQLLRDENGLSRRWGVVLGALYGLALMSKFNLAAIAGLIELAVLWVAWRKGQWRLWWQVNGLIVFVTGLIAGWWFVRNQLLYGEPTGFEQVTVLWGARNPAESFGVAVFELPYAWTSLWGRFGYGQIPLPEGVYLALRWLVGGALLGVLWPLVLRQKEELRWSVVPVVFLLVNVGLFFSVLFAYLLVSPAGPMGRFFFPALPSLAVLVFYGLSQWVVVLARFWRRPQVDWATTAVLVNVGMGSLTVVALFGYLAYAYARPPVFASDAAVPNPINAQFDFFVNLRGYEVQETAVRPGEPVTIDLYWEVTGKPPGNYLLFVHLIDTENGVIVAQRDTHPGLGNFPSQEWNPGDRFIDSIRVFIPETAYTPTTVSVQVGLYAASPEAYRLAITAADGTFLGDALSLGQVTILPAQTTDIPNPLDQNFNNDVRLIGYAYSARTLHAGEKLDVTLYWRAETAVLPNYLVQVWLVDDKGQAWATADSQPQNGQSPMSTWQAGQVVADSHKLTIGDNIPPGSYHIHVALIDPMTKEPQNIVAEDGHWIDNRLLLSRVQIRP
ncbi:MAG: hypothetical protein D6706_01705 [Chloroflexi bacterium]|nr:MAG: hypothetical protein D6706_01705 [Chloroflexota bacterium]